MVNRRIYLGREVSKYAEIAGGAILTITSLFFVLMVMGFEITGTDDICLGTPEDPCVSYGKICNLGPDNYDIYNPEEFKMDFSPTVKDYWIFFKDGRVKKQFLYELGVNTSTEGWRYENFTDATKPRKDRVYVHRFARYSCQEYMLVGLKTNEDDVIKWGVGVGAEYLDPFWYGVNDTANILASTEIIIESGTPINISIIFDYIVNYGVVTGETFSTASTGSSSSGITQNGTYFWIIDYTNKQVYKYHMNGTYTNQSFSIGSTSLPIGITQNGTFIWVLDQVLETVYKYHMNGTYTGETFDTSTCGEEIPTGLTQNGTYFWVVHQSGDEVCKYHMNGTFIEIDFDISSSGNNHPMGITQNGTYFWITDLNDDEVYQYHMNGTYTGETFNITPPGSSIFGITQNSSYFWVSDSTNKQVYQYSLTGGYPPYVCVDIEHQDYGENYTCGRNLNFIINITNFIKTEFNDSTTIKTISSNQTIYVSSHQYDEVKNLSINLTGIEKAKNVKIYINGTLSNDIGFIYNTSIGGINETAEISFNLINGNSTTFSIPKGATVTNTTLNFTGSNLTWEISEYSIPETWSSSYSSPSPALPSGSQGWYGPVSNGVDGNTISGTGGWIDGPVVWDVEWMAYIYENYTKDTDTMTSNWSSSYGCDSNDDITFDVDCWNGSTWIEILSKTGTNCGSYAYEEYLVPATCESQNILQIKNSLQYGDIGYGAIQRAYYIEGKVNHYRTSPPKNLTIEVGIIDGDYEYQGSGELIGSNSTTDFVSAVNNYLYTCTADDDGFCDVPIYFSSDDGGSLSIDNFEVLYTYDPNPVNIDSSLIQAFLDNSDGKTNIPISFSIDEGSFNVSDLIYSYIGGNDTFEIFAYEQVNTSNNETLNLLVYYSSFFKNLPYTWVNKLFFMPKTNSSKNVTAYGQTTIIPAYNITTTNYGGDINLSIKVNESFPCLDLSWSINATKNESNVINTTWQTLNSNIEYLNNTKLWLWADFDNCNASDQRILQPSLEIEGYCINCEWI